MREKINKKRKVPKTAFKPGREKTGGRKKGQANYITMELKEAMLTGIALCGEDNEGHDAAAGYFHWLAWNHPQTMGRLIERAFPYLFKTTIVDGTSEDKKYETIEAIEMRCKERGIPLPVEWLQ